MTRQDFEDTYSLRWYRPDDREPFLSLHADAFGGGSEEWFEWKYLDNPFVSHVPILVAETHSGTFAGVRPQVPVRMRAGDETLLALRFGDTMVHPDHRRRGVFSTLTRRALDHYARMPPRLCFNCPNDLSRPGFLDAGGRLVAELPSYYRIQNPGAILADATGRDRAGLLDGVGRAAARGFLALRGLGVGPASGDVTVNRHDGVPLDLLASLYERRPPPGLHAVRDEDFLGWRYDNPAWEYEFHSAHRCGRPVVALVTGRGTLGALDVATVVDVLPFGGEADWMRGLEALLGAVLPAYRDADVVAYSGRVLPGDVLARAGFLSDRSLPLSAVASPSTLVAYDLSGAAEPDFSVGGLDAEAPGTWWLGYVELDAH